MIQVMLFASQAGLFVLLAASVPALVAVVLLAWAFSE